ncbi:MAG: Gfo/Idh/MocA family oxidoreductase [Gemmatimonadetes bacterium]|nr:Gfo/Idh/MocA family oxidoreductase [Gemmatimonadota bacterium]
MPKTVLNAALIGCGSRGRGHLETMKAFDDLQFVAVCDPVEDLRNRVAEENAVPRRYEDIGDMLAKEELDLAVIATPAHLNGQCALPVIQAGVHTLLEKPPGLSGAETEGLRDAANASGAKVLVGWNRRFHSLICKARSLIEERGPIIQIVAEFHKSMTGLHRRGFPDHLLDNFIYETPIHAIDLTRSLAGSSPIAELHAVARRTNSPFVDVYAALIRFENGCVAQLTANFTTDARLERYEIHGRDCSAYLEGVRNAVVQRDGTTEEFDVVESGGTAEQARFLVDCIKEDRPVDLPAAGLAEAVETMKLADRIRAELRD